MSLTLKELRDAIARFSLVLPDNAPVQFHGVTRIIEGSQDVREIGEVDRYRVEDLPHTFPRGLVMLIEEGA